MAQPIQTVPSSSSSIDPNSGFNSETKIFQSLRPNITLPPATLSLTFSSYALCLLRLSSSPETTLLVDSTTGATLSRDQVIRHSENLAASIQNLYGLSKGDVALVLSPASFRVPILYFALLSLGVIVAPIDPNSTLRVISGVVSQCNPVIAFSTAAAAPNLTVLRLKTVVVDSPEFDSMMTTPAPIGKLKRDEVKQNENAAILYSSGTSASCAMKCVVFTHRNLTSVLAGFYGERSGKGSEVVALYPVPLFHVYGFWHCMKSLVAGETVVLTEKFALAEILKLVRDFKVTHLSMGPLEVAMLAKGDGAVDGCDLSSLKVLTCGGGPLGKRVAESFRSRFPHVILAQWYGLTESCGVASRPKGPTECDRLGSAGRLIANCEAKIVDPTTALALPPGEQGELWIRGPTIMKGYMDEKQKGPTVLESDGWLKTGDLGYIDSDGFLFVIDRLEDLIKFKDYKIAPSQLEEVLLSHPDVTDAAVIPFLSEGAGQEPMALVIRRAKSTLDEEQLVDFVAKQVEPHQKIRRVSFVESLPKNAMGKTLRKELIQKLAPPIN